MSVGMDPQSDGPAAGTRDRLYEEVYGRIFRYLGKLGGGHTELAEELTQETMVRLLRSHGQLRDTRQFIPWAFRIATNVWRDERRRVRGLRPILAARPEGAASGSAEQHELARRVLRQVERPAVAFEDVGGMDAVKEEIRMKILYPLQKPELFRAYGTRIGGAPKTLPTTP